MFTEPFRIVDLGVFLDQANYLDRAPWRRIHNRTIPAQEATQVYPPAFSASTTGTPTLEELRIRAAKRVVAGARAQDVADDLGLRRSTVFAWAPAYRSGGVEALRARAIPGRPPKLSNTQLNRLYALIVGANPAQFQQPGGSDGVEQQHGPGVRHDPSTVGVGEDMRVRTGRLAHQKGAPLSAAI